MAPNVPQALPRRQGHRITLPPLLAARDQAPKVARTNTIDETQSAVARLMQT
jgi:hypothetical protein